MRDFYHSIYGRANFTMDIDICRHEHEHELLNMNMNMNMKMNRPGRKIVNIGYPIALILFSPILEQTQISLSYPIQYRNKRPLVRKDYTPPVLQASLQLLTSLEFSGWTKKMSSNYALYSWLLTKKGLYVQIFRK